MATSNARAVSHDDSPDPRERDLGHHHADRADNPPLFPHGSETQQPRQSPPHSISHILSHDNNDDDEARRMSAAYTLTTARGPTHSPPMPTLVDQHADSPSPASKRRRISSSPEHQGSPRQSSPYDDQAGTKPKPKFTGHRRDITSASLTPLEAPTRPRTYSANSVTRRKDAPVLPSMDPSHPYFQQSPPHPYPQHLPAPPSTQYYDSRDIGRKRLRPTSMSADESEEDRHAPDAGAGPSPAAYAASPAAARGAANPESGSGGSAVDPLEIKRRQNTVAARRSRQRKLDHVRGLEEQVKSLTTERDDLRVTVGKLEYKIEVYREVIARGGNGNPPPTLD